MSIPVSSSHVDQQIRDAFRDEWRAILMAGRHQSQASDESPQLLLSFAEHYRSLRALPRRRRRWLERHCSRGVGAIALLMALGQAPAWAATISVAPNTPPPINADGRCSLVEAIVNANNDGPTHSDCVAGAGPDTILLPSNSTQPIDEPLPAIRSATRIDGRGSTIVREMSADPDMDWLLRVGPPGELTLNRTTVSGAGEAKVGVHNAGGVLTLRGSRIENVGTTYRYYRSATGLLNDGVATLNDSTISDNGRTSRYGSGSGMRNRAGGSITLVNSSVLRNGGSGISNAGELTVIRSVVSGNRAYGGGGISNGGELTLIRSIVSGNTAGIGGGISNNGTATLVRSTVSGNEVLAGYGSGGGIANGYGDTLRLFNSTVSGNHTFYYGGGVFNRGGTLVLASSTVTGNSAFRGGGGLYVSWAGSATLKRSIVSGNGPETTGREIAGRGVITADNYNLFGQNGYAGTPGFSPGPTDIVPNVSLDRILVPLARNGGAWPVQTHALAIGSPALDASPNDSDCPPADQRDNPRPQGAACDIGAFEGSAARCNGVVTTMVGTAQRDFLKGTPRPDVINGLGGDDMITGLEGDDIICGGAGPDTVWGGMGNDILRGWSGDDLLFGNAGRDKLDGGLGTDTCDGGQPSTEPGDTAVNCETVEQVP